MSTLDESPFLQQFTVGALEVVCLDDGVMQVPTSFYAGFDSTRHPELIAPDGTIHAPIGCFLIRSGDSLVLIDAGVGHIPMRSVEAGLLPSQLARVGVSPEDIDVVVCTHLHIDHIGWLLDDGKPFFANATVRFGRADWEQFVEHDPGRPLSWIERQIRALMESLSTVAVLDPLDGDMEAIAPGVTARFTPGHTWGHYGVVLSSGQDRAYILGDAIECPLQIEEPDIHVISDIDVALAARTRDALLREIESSDAVVGASHFPGLRFGRVLSGQGRRLFQVG